ncbi:hypothetical protein HMPREF9144_0616 [Prevotella pallens ATCC 700821]|uniref:Uncharacterized protein n=1 Tax=Prevotella pallens ATCC 700821 TaxID=997353 RepID=F9DG26_9BACT|nr:hypothetical protein HMPREF9144_0616 [Prevotella pallens ATCC 700821]
MSVVATVPNYHSTNIYLFKKQQANKAFANVCNNINTYSMSS